MNRRPTFRGTVCAAVLAALCPSAATQTQADPGFESALSRYREVITRKPLRHHTEGRDRLAQTRSLAALPLLAEDYAKTKLYPEQTRYTLASLLGQHFTQAEALGPIADLRRSHQKPGDAWLWAETLRNEVDAGKEAEVLAIATEHKVVAMRAAAILAIGESKRGDVKPAIVANCLALPKKEGDRMLLLGAMTGALHAQKKRVNSEDYRDALRAYIGLLGDDVKLSQLAKVQISRHLQWILNGPALFVNPEAWLELLERGEIKAPPSGGTSAAQRFFGIETEGERFCYVLDMSDSMCKEIAPEFRQMGPLTGGGKPKKKRSMELDEGDLPWAQIKTRWDLAREHLRISLSRLDDDKYFSIVWFGTDAGTLDATKGMVKATRANIDRAMRELDGIKPGPRDPVKAPDGQLMGRTNLHSGLRVAFGLANRGYVEEHAYVHADALTEGADTVFLLSDGAPSWDGFAAVDKDYGEGKVVVDVEYNADAPRSANLEYHGPYTDERWLLEDLRRMNAFRRIRIHCVGLGEANIQLLQRLADVGNGELFVVGKSKPKSEGGSGQLDK
jgi:hypothetical protein